MRTHTAEERYAITLRVSRDLLEEIRLAAKKESRSLNSYVVHKLLTELMQHNPHKQTTSKKK